MFTVRMPVVLCIKNDDRSRAKRAAEKKLKQFREQFKDDVEYLQNLRKVFVKKDPLTEKS